VSFAANGDIYVADTHYHRVIAFDGEGDIAGEFGEFGKGDGCFVYPTDVAFVGIGEDLQILVSEYGGNDRISVFDGAGEYIRSFSSWGSGKGQVSRPSAICVDGDREVLYIADACNHRIAVYDFQGQLIKYFGTVGRGRGELRYPYDLALMPNGNLIVCEFGNNRLQLFDADGVSLGIYGGAGREPGQLAYPWGVAVDGRGRVFVVDAGNNRIQVWRL
jgi:DNA-binding beta-propeller fold protein YncE